MPRNLDTRVELLAPVRDEALRGELLDTLERCMADDTNAWALGEDGAWTRRAPGGAEPRNAQDELMARHAARAAEAAAGRRADPLPVHAAHQVRERGRLARGAVLALVSPFAAEDSGKTL